MVKKHSIFRFLYSKWTSHKNNVVEQKIVLAIFLVLLTIFSSLSVRFLKLKTDAASVCPFASGDTVHGSVNIIPTLTESVFDCSDRDIIIAADGEVIVHGYINLDGELTGDYGAEILFKSLTIESGGKFQANGTGYRPGETDGSISNAIASTDNVGGSGGGYGGAGGEGVSDGIHPPGEPGNSYGVSQNPSGLGGAGAPTGNGGLGGYGGGSIKIIVTELFTLDGVISANGELGNASIDNTTSGGGGAGGSIFIEADSFAGGGQVLANGAGASEAVYQGGGGGGGRIQMFCNTVNNFFGIANANGGVTSHSQDGGAGSVLGPTCRPNTPTVLKQFKLNLTTEVLVGGATAESSFYLASNLTDPDGNDVLYLDVEVRPIGTSFTNQITHSQANGFVNPQTCSGSGSTCGRVNITGLVRSIQYHWQARVRDNKGGFSPWVSYGGNTEAESDILISGQATNIILLENNNQSGVVNTNLANPLKVKVTDSNGFPVPGFTVNWSVLNGANGGGILGNVYTETNIDGEAANTYRLGKQAGTNNNLIRVTASGLGGSPVDFTASGTADILSYFTLSAPDVSLVDTNFDVLIKAYDQFNNIKNDLEGSIDLSAVDPLNTAIPKSGTLNPNQVVFGLGDAGQKTISVTYNTAESIKIKASFNDAVGYSHTIAVVNTLGSCPDVDGIIDTNDTWAATIGNNGIFDCTGLTIRVMSNATLTLQSYDSGDTNYNNDLGVTVLANGMIIELGSTVTASEKGYGATRGPGAGGSYGGYGHTNNPYGDYANPLQLGSGGQKNNSAYTGPAGGAIKIVVNSMTINGTLSTNGGSTYATGGSAQGTGSSGGSIFINTDIIDGTGVIQANGGAAAGGHYFGRGGSGGRIAVYYTSSDFPITSKSNIQAFGGYGPNVGYGGPGTIFLDDVDDTNYAGMLYINNNSHNGREAVVMGVGPYSLDLINVKEYGHLVFYETNSVVDITTGGESAITGDGTSTVTINGIIKLPTTFSLKKYRLNITGDYEGAETLTIGETTGNPVAQLVLYAYTNNRRMKGAYNNYQFSNLNVDTTGILSLKSYDGNASSSADNDIDGRDDYGITLDIGDKLEINTGGNIESNLTGYISGAGPGGEGSYGGYGHSGNPYGSLYYPTSLGTAGGNNGSGYAYPAGGAMIINSENLVNNGTIAANGGDCVYVGASAYCTGSSGGSIVVNTTSIVGSGVIRANGGNAPGGHYFGRGGSGGRIAVYYSEGDFPLTNKANIQTFGGYGSNVGYGGAGTIYIDNILDSLTKGALYINNNAHNGREAGVPGVGPYEFDLISIKEYGHLKFPDANVVVDISSGGEEAVAADGTASLSVAGLIKLPQVFSIKKYTLDVIGDYEGASTLTVGEASGIVGRLKIYAYTTKRRGLGKYNTYFYENLTVQTTGTITLTSYDGNSTNNFDNDIGGNDDYGVILNVVDTLDVKVGGNIESNNYGYISGAGPGGEGTYGGYGNSGNPYGDLYNPTSLGTAGGTNGSGYAYPGGGSIRIDTLNLINNGTISANGGDCIYVGASAYCTGSSGGSILVNTINIDGVGTIRANGGNAPGGHYFGRGGGGGRIAIYYDAGIYQLTDKNHVQAFGGYGSNVGYGGAGTIFIDNNLDSLTKGVLYINNNSHNGREAGVPGVGPYEFDLISIKEYGHLKFPDTDVVVDISTGGEEAVAADGTASLSVAGLIKLPEIFSIKKFTLDIIGDYEGAEDLTIGEASGLSGNLKLYAYTAKRRSGNKLNDYLFQNLTVETTGKMTLVSYDGNPALPEDNDIENRDDYGVILNVVELFDVNLGGIVESDSTGYISGAGPGGEGSYGGYGQSGNPYGDIYLPISLGSAGGTNGSGYAYPAGGAISINSATINNNGIISSNGGNCVYVGASAYCSGSSGGSILINTTTLNGTGLIRTNGGSAPGGHYFGWGGSGGRIAVYYTNGDFDFSNKNNIQSFGGLGSNVGYAGAGTIFLDNTTDELLKGTIYVNNNGHNGKEAGVSGVGPFEFDLISIKEYGHLKFSDENVVVDISTGGEDAITADGTASISVLGLIKLPTTFSIKKFTLDVSGDYEGADILSVGEASGQTGSLKLYAYTSKRRSLDKYNTYQFSTLTVKETGSISLISYDGNSSSNNDDNPEGLDDYGVILDISEIFEIKTGANVNSDSSGYSVGAGPGGEGSYGGYGQSGSPYGSASQPVDLGTAGGKNSSGYVYPGGGAIKINAETLINNGNVSVNGGDCVYAGASAYCSASSGGSIWVNVVNLDGNGVFKANGGNAPSGHYFGRGGSGGRIALYFADATFDYTDKTKVQVFGGYGPNVGYAGPGSIYIKDINDTFGSLIIENNNNIGRAENFLAIDYYYKDFTLGNNVYAYALGDTTDNNTRGVVLRLSGDFNMGTGARIDGVGQGFVSDTGPGAGLAGVNLSGGGGGANGGAGGAGQSDGTFQAQGGQSYNTENQMQPFMVGSGGGRSGAGALGGSGGGAFAIDARTGNINLYGTIDVSGTNGMISSPGGGGGAGGSLLLIGESCDITGSLIAEGGDGGDNNFDGGGGGGGRASILLTSPLINCDTSLATVSVDLGLSSEGVVGQVGTYIGVSTLPQIELNSQNKIDGELIPIGGVISDNQLNLKVQISDPGANLNDPKELVADFELIEDDQYFITGISFNEPSLNAMSPLGASVAGLSVISTPVQTLVSGDPLDVTVQIDEGLISGQGYKWRARVRDVSLGTSSSWVSYGNNGESADFIISTMTDFDIVPSQTNIDVGVPLSLTVRAIDNVGVTVDDYVGTGVFSSNPSANPGPSLPSNYSFGIVDLGIHTFTNELIFFTSGVYTITITDSINSNLTGTTVEITVNALPEPTVTVIPTNIATSTPTLEPTVSLTPTSTDNEPLPTYTVTPSITNVIVPPIVSCSVNPNQAICQVDVEITNVVVTINDADLSAKICWDTNILTVGSIIYGEELLSHSTDLETIFEKSHCANIDDLKDDTGYGFNITATSHAGKKGSHEGTFSVGKGTIPQEVPVSCITLDQYSFNAESQLLLSYNTAIELMCSVNFSYLDEKASLFKDIETTLMKYHTSKLNLYGLNEDRDIAYTILCDVDSQTLWDGSMDSCELNGSIPREKIGVYLPDTGDTQVNDSNPSIMNTLTSALTVLSVPLVVGSMSNLFFGFFWFRFKRKNHAWGLVYDGIDKKPISFAVVRLFDSISGRLLKEEVSSIEGKYNFLIGAGNYKLVAEHSQYNSLERGLIITAESGEVAEEMALTKRNVKLVVRPYGLWKNIQLFFIKYNNYIVTFGFLFSIIASIISPSWYNFTILALYFIQETILLLSRGIQWARVLDSGTGEGMPGVFVRLYHLEQKRQIEVTLTDKLGRYKFISADGKYLASAYAEGYIMMPPLSDQKMISIRIKGGITKNDIKLKREIGII